MDAKEIMIELTREKNQEFTVEFVSKEDPRIGEYRLGLEKVFHGEYLKCLYVPLIPGRSQAALLMGCGEFSQLGLVEIRELAAAASKEMKSYGIWEGTLDLTPFVGHMGKRALAQVVLGLRLGTYEYQKVGHEAKEDEAAGDGRESAEDHGTKEVRYRLYGFDGAGDREVLLEALELAEDIRFVRDLVNCPGNLLRPQELGRAIAQYMEGTAVETELMEYEQLKKLGLEGLCGVGGSSQFSPCLAVLRYRGNPGMEETYGLIGKGVTCDTGGYCLKGAKSMAGIKGDMAGAAAVAGALHGAAMQKLKVNITAVLPLCENRISPSSHLPGDVITIFGGRTVEILNTDAEGRLILADAVSYAVGEEKVTRVVDIATLTGAVWQALGYTVAGSMSDHEEFYGMFEEGLASSGERYLRFPYGKEHEKLLESPVAELKNIGGDCCGVITAGLFIRHFAAGLPWIHLDIAGTAWNDTPTYAFESKGATGAGVLSLYYLMKEAEKS